MSDEDTLIDKDGVVYEKGWFGEYHPKVGWLGVERDTTWLGQPNAKQNWLGQPEEARGWLGMPIRSADGKVLYRRAEAKSGSWGGDGDAVAAFLALLMGIGLLVLLFYVVSALLALVAQFLAALFRGWRHLVKQYPRAMLVIHLLLGMGILGRILYIAGFPRQVQLVGATLVPIFWGWLWLTRRLPLIFMPINALLAGGVLWWTAHLTTSVWLSIWLYWTADIPLLINLPLLLAFLPLFLWFWTLGARRWPRLFQPLNLLLLGAVFSFLLLRVWKDWQTLWIIWMSPIPLLSQAVGWLIFLSPLGIWLWHKGQTRWPLPFTALNLLLFGGILGLTAYHTKPAWLSIWNHWAFGLPFASAPILTISLAPFTLWSWSWVSRRWAEVFVVPNLLLSGSVLWLILDRTRPLWMDAWQMVWGKTPLDLDPALLMLVLPLAVWVWGHGSRRWPYQWGIFRAMLWGCFLWWVAERTRIRWHVEWNAFVGSTGPDLALLALFAPLSLWVWLQLYRRRPREIKILTWAGVALSLVWVTGRLLPDSGMAFRFSIAFLPPACRGWLWLLSHYPRIAWPLILLPPAGIGLLAWLVPDGFQVLLAAFVTWLAEQGIDIIAR